jgi:tetratricopeptide (TPR) repeat protein
MAYQMLWYLDPGNLLIMVFYLFLARTAWRAYREFRLLVPDAGRKAPLRRSLGGHLAMAASVAYTAILACFIVWAGYVNAVQFRLPTAVNRKAAAAMAQFEAGTALIKSDPAQAESHFRRALPLWEELVREVPSELNYQINLGATRTNLALSAGAQGRFAEAREQLTRSAAQWEALASGPLAASKRAIIDRNRDLVRSVLPSMESAVAMNEFAVSMKQGVALQKAGDDAGVEAAYRRALDTLRTARGSPSLSPSAPLKLLDKSEAAVRTSLALLLAVPGRSPEQAREAVALAKRAVELDPDIGNTWCTLALARYRVGDWPGASSAIEHSMGLRGGGDANDWVILAMIRWRQGDRAEARRWYEQATSKIKRQDGSDGDLLRLRDEASALLATSPSQP